MNEEKQPIRRIPRPTINVDRDGPSTVHFDTFSPELKCSLVIILALLLTQQFLFSQVLYEDSTDSV